MVEAAETWRHTNRELSNISIFAKAKHEDMKTEGTMLRESLPSLCLCAPLLYIEGSCFNSSNFIPVVSATSWIRENLPTLSVISMIHWLLCSLFLLIPPKPQNEEKQVMETHNILPPSWLWTLHLIPGFLLLGNKGLLFCQVTTKNMFLNEGLSSTF